MDMSALYTLLGICPPAPVYRWTTAVTALPTEILVCFFQVACDVDAEEDSSFPPSTLVTQQGAQRALPRPIALSHVCPRWRTIVLATPSLWASAKISVRDATPFSSGQRSLLQMWASRSRSTPLTVNVSLSCDYGKTHREEEALSVLEAVATLVRQHKGSCMGSERSTEYMLESSLDISAPLAHESYSLCYLDALDADTHPPLPPPEYKSDNDEWDARKSAYAVHIQGRRQHARLDGVGLPGLLRDRYGSLQGSLTTLNLRGGTCARQTQTLSAEELLSLIRDFQRLRRVQAHVTHQHDNQRLHVPVTPPAATTHHGAGAHDEEGAFHHAEHQHHNRHHLAFPFQHQQEHIQNQHVDEGVDDEIVSAPHLQHLDLSWEAVANAGLVLRALHAPVLEQLALRRRGTSPFWLGHWEHLHVLLSRSGSPLRAIVLRNLDCTTLRLGACLAQCADTLQGLALDSCTVDETEMRGLREGVARCSQFKMLSVVDCPGITQGWCVGMSKVMMRRGVETNIRMLEPKKMANALGMW